MGSLQPLFREFGDVCSGLISICKAVRAGTTTEGTLRLHSVQSTSGVSGMAGGTGLLTIQLKNADGITADEQLRDLDPDTSVLEVKQLLQACYPGQPPSASQKIVFAGRCDTAAGADWTRACTRAWRLAESSATS
jgi:hypothetical protein